MSAFARASGCGSQVTRIAGRIRPATRAMHDDAVLAIRRRWTAAAIGLLAVGCTQSPGGVDLSGGTVAADDGDDGDGSTSTATGSDDAPATDDSTGEPPPMGGPCNSDEDCVDDPAGAVCD